ncbi:hypothetical protein FRUB_01660 [Fimbriiglobus ruber]|uniref:Carboxypeptidase regulatory-like domain-containing protein n=1 Tax=Fimbriiglobus ruber TaxID=1908690 RepID=A0A225E745_9BACT|nr:hypothetical protein FRUB_01660 [Fimbriiglobus ruber]
MGLAGCAEEPPPPAEAEGVVTYDGKAIDTGIVSFTAPDGTSTGGAAVTDGKYHLDPEAGLRPGKYRVAIRWAKKIGEKNPNAGYGQSPDVIVQGLPEKYNTESVLTADLQSGPNTVDFKLEK